MEPLYILLAISFYTLPIIIPFLWIELEINEIPQKIKALFALGSLSRLKIFERRVQGDTVIDFVPSNDSSSHITNEIWHYFQCSRRQLRKEEKAGEVHRHDRYCQRIKSVKHVTWHIRSK